jgi:cellobiose phosphorylase
LEWILGIRPTIDGLVIDPCIPLKWKSFKVRRIFRRVTYTIEVRNPQHVRSGISSVQIDDKKYRVEGIGRTPLLPVLSPGSSHTVVVVLGYPGSEG